MAQKLQLSQYFHQHHQARHIIDCQLDKPSLCSNSYICDAFCNAEFNDLWCKVDCSLIGQGTLRKSGESWKKRLAQTADYCCLGTVVDALVMSPCALTISVFVSTFPIQRVRVKVTFDTLKVLFCFVLNQRSLCFFLLLLLHVLIGNSAWIEAITKPQLCENQSICSVQAKWSCLKRKCIWKCSLYAKQNRASTNQKAGAN